MKSLKKQTQEIKEFAEILKNLSSDERLQVRGIMIGLQLSKVKQA